MTSCVLRSTPCLQSPMTLTSPVATPCKCTLCIRIHQERLGVYLNDFVKHIEAPVLQVVTEGLINGNDEVIGDSCLLHCLHTMTFNGVNICMWLHRTSAVRSVQQLHGGQTSRIAK